MNKTALRQETHAMYGAINISFITKRRLIIELQTDEVGSHVLLNI